MFGGGLVEAVTEFVEPMDLVAEFLQSGGILLRRLAANKFIIGGEECQHPFGWDRCSLVADGHIAFHERLVDDVLLRAVLALAVERVFSITDTTKGSLDVVGWVDSHLDGIGGIKIEKIKAAKGGAGDEGW